MGSIRPSIVAVLFALGAPLMWPMGCEAAPGHPTIAEVRGDLASMGPTRTVQALWSDKRWDWIEDRVAAGDTGWIALAPRLAPGTDAGTSEGLSISLAEGLTRNPRAVLAVLTLGDDSVLGVQQVCEAPFIEETPQHHATYMRATFRALAGVRAPDLHRVKQACLQRLSQAR